MFECIIFSHHDTETRNFFYEVFTNLGYKIITTFTHKEILEILKKERPEYIILDPAISDLALDRLLEKIKLTAGDIKITVLEGNKNKTEIIREAMVMLKEKRAVSSAAPQEAKKVQIKANILVVEDEPEPVQLIKNYLSKRGYNIDTAISGEEAITKIDLVKPDIVLLDIYMSGIDGLVVLKTIKDRDKSIIVIITTAVEDDRIIAEAMKLGANGYLIKPFNLAKLEETILVNVIQNNPA